MHLRTVAAQLLGLFVDVEKEQFSERLTIVLPLLNKSLMQENIQEVSNKPASVMFSWKLGYYIYPGWSCVHFT